MLKMIDFSVVRIIYNKRYGNVYTSYNTIPQIAEEISKYDKSSRSS